MSTITIIGSLGADPELRFTQGGKAVANFNVAESHRVKQGNDWVDGPTTWWRCTVWQELAEHVAESLQKGTRVIVQGRTKTETYTDRDGNDRTNLVVDVEAVGPELRFATAQVTRSQQGSGQRGQQGAGWNQQQTTGNDPWAATPTDDQPPF